MKQSIFRKINKYNYLGDNWYIWVALEFTVMDENTLLTFINITDNVKEEVGIDDESGHSVFIFEAFEGK